MNSLIERERGILKFCKRRCRFQDPGLRSPRGIEGGKKKNKMREPGTTDGRQPLPSGEKEKEKEKKKKCKKFNRSDSD